MRTNSGPLPFRIIFRYYNENLLFSTEKEY
nr:MAG TPA: hypothetical protein [Caudoviricetes sp.]